MGQLTNAEKLHKDTGEIVPSLIRSKKGATHSIWLARGAGRSGRGRQHAWSCGLMNDPLAGDRQTSLPFGGIRRGGGEREDLNPGGGGGTAGAHRMLLMGGRKNTCQHLLF